MGSYIQLSKNKITQSLSNIDKQIMWGFLKYEKWNLALFFYKKVIKETKFKQVQTGIKIKTLEEDLDYNGTFEQYKKYKNKLKFMATFHVASKSVWKCS